jgi:tetratricopeptide (TPR) repeat protein
MVAAVAVVVMIGAVGSAAFGFVNLRRARSAEAQTQAARQLAETARSESEKLIGFLLEDFYEELKPTGRIEIVGKLADKAVAYYDDLPPELMTPQTKLYRGLALVRKASAFSESGRVNEAAPVADQAQKIFEELRAVNGGSNEATVGLALAHMSRITPGFATVAKADLEIATALLRPLVATGRATRTAKLALADGLQYLAHAQSNSADGVVLCEESRRILTEMGALDLKDLTAASIYGDVTDSQSRMVQRLGQTDEAERLAGIVNEIAQKVLAMRPGDLRAMKNRFNSADMLAQVAWDRHDLDKAEANYEKALASAGSYVQFNPADSEGWRSLASGGASLGDTLREQGRMSAALNKYRETTALVQDQRNRSGMDLTFIFARSGGMILSAQMQQQPAAGENMTEIRKMVETWIKDRNIDREQAQLVTMNVSMAEFDVLAAEGKYARLHDRAVEILAQLDKVKLSKEIDPEFRDNLRRRARTWQAESAVRLGRVEEALEVSRQNVNEPIFGRLDKLSQLEMMARARVRLGRALLLAGNRAEALGPLVEAEAFYREKQVRGAKEVSFHLNFASALYHLARAQADDETGRNRRRDLLDEALSVLGGLSFEAQQLVTSKEILDWVTKARREVGA